MALKRSSGILLHVTSLPGRYGIGTLGEEAYRFVDWLAAAGQRLWQILPLGPTGFADSPYQCFSAFAGNPLLISLEALRAAGWIGASDLAAGRAPAGSAVDYGRLIPFKSAVLRKAYDAFLSGASPGDREAFRAFCRQNRQWLDEFALFMALKDRFGGKPWFRWPLGIRRRSPRALRQWRTRLADEAGFHRFLQFVFFRQWRALKAHANARGIRIIGDMPLYVAHDSADAWTRPRAFRINGRGRPTAVGGVPPDGSLEAGQLWGNPVFHWPLLERSRFAWWTARVRAALELYDVLRIDHFIGLVRYWSVPYGRKTAAHGRWMPAPGEKLLKTLQRRLGDLPLIAEDLGAVTPAVIRLRDRYRLPGMRILQYGFGSDEHNEHLPRNYPQVCVAYTGTHDNPTTRAWLAAARREQRLAARYAGVRRVGVWDLIRLLWASPARLAVVPLQDVLELDDRARMNRPGVAAGNWKWRFAPAALTPALARRLRRLSAACGR